MSQRTSTNGLIVAHIRLLFMPIFQGYQYEEFKTARVAKGSRNSGFVCGRLYFSLVFTEYNNLFYFRYFLGRQNKPIFQNIRHLLRTHRGDHPRPRRLPSSFLPSPSLPLLLVRPRRPVGVTQLLVVRQCGGACRLRKCGHLRSQYWLTLFGPADGPH